MSVTVVLACLPLLVVSDTFEARMGFCGPKSVVHVAQPAFRWEVWSEKGSVSSVKMTLNGKEVAATYDPVRRAVVFTPSAQLSDGDYHVDCSVTFAGEWVFKKNWDLSVKAKQTLTEADADQRAGLALANSFRAKLGLPPLVFEPRIAAAAVGHSKYLSSNNLRGHGERPSDPLFLAPSPSDRMEAFGWVGGNFEGIAYDTTSPEEAVRGLFEAPYHRIPFMQPGPIEVGLGFAGGKATMDFEATRREAIQISPAENEMDVPLEWHCQEEPNPLRLHPELPKSVGYPIVVAAFGAAKLRLTQAEGSLYDSDGKAVAIRLNTPAIDPNLDQAAILIPTSPLRPSTRYRVVFKGKTNFGQTVDREWWFTTAKS